MTALAVSVSTGSPGSFKPISAWFALGRPGRLQRWQLFLHWTSRTESTSHMLQWGSLDKFLHRFATTVLKDTTDLYWKLYSQLSLFVPTYSRTPFQPDPAAEKKVPCHFPRHWNGSPLSFDMLRHHSHIQLHPVAVQHGWAPYSKSSTRYAEAYMVLGLNTVCDVYFAGSIDLLCDAWNLTPDVAGATCLHLIPLDRERKGWNRLEWQIVQPKDFREDKN